MRLFEPHARRLLQNGRGEWPEDFAVLDPAIENLLHLRAARIGDDAAISERARAPFRAALEPAENLAVSDNSSSAAQQFALRQFLDRVSLAWQAACFNRAVDFIPREPWTPICMIHRKRSRLPEYLVPHIKSRANRKPAIARGWMHVNLLEARGIENLSVRHAIKGHAAGKAHGL